jgi:CBS domain containing-hemolysin-like protein
MPIGPMIEAVKHSRFSRIPIYQDHKGKVLGILHAKDLLAYCPGSSCDGKLIPNLLRPPYYVPENKKAFDLLTELQARRQRLALVVDEYGTLVGLVSVEDLLEELFGEIPQEFKEEEKLWEEVAPGIWRVNAALSLTDFNDLLDMELPMEEFDTVGGLVLSLFGELPRLGDRASYEDLTFTVVRMKGTRILEVEVRRVSP